MLPGWQSQSYKRVPEDRLEYYLVFPQKASDSWTLDHISECPMRCRRALECVQLFSIKCCPSLTSIR